MKKCPFCAEEIQDEAIVCRYCGRDLSQSINQPASSAISQSSSGRPSVLPSKAKRSFWTTGAIWAVVLTVLASLGTIIRFLGSPSNSQAEYIARSHDLIGYLTMGVVANFLVWLLIFSILTLLWRKLRWGLVGIFIIVGLLIAIIIIGSNSYLLNNISEIFRAASTPTPTRRPTNSPAIPSNCILWSSVTNSDVGKSKCVYGRIVEIQGTGQNEQKILFSKDIRTFSLWSTEYYFSDLTVNECVAAVGKIYLSKIGSTDYQVWKNTFIYMNIGEIELYEYTECP